MLTRLIALLAVLCCLSVVAGCSESEPEASTPPATDTAAPAGAAGAPPAAPGAPAPPPGPPSNTRGNK